MLLLLVSISVAIVFAFEFGCYIYLDVYARSCVVVWTVPWAARVREPRNVKCLSAYLPRRVTGGGEPSVGCDSQGTVKGDATETPVWKI